MKRLTLTLAFAFATLFTFAQSDCKQKDNATVVQYSGIYVFTFSTPVNQYENLGTIRKTFVAESIGEYLEKAAYYTKNQFPNADAIIFHNIKLGFTKDSWEVIRFKK
jgi:hypothetical protein